MEESFQDLVKISPFSWPKGRAEVGPLNVCTSSSHELRPPLQLLIPGATSRAVPRGPPSTKGARDETRGCRPPCELLPLTALCRVGGKSWSPGVLIHNGTLGLWGNLHSYTPTLTSCGARLPVRPRRTLAKGLSVPQQTALVPQPPPAVGDRGW